MRLPAFFAMMLLSACGNGTPGPGSNGGAFGSLHVSVLSGNAGLPEDCSAARSEDFPQLVVDPRNPEHVSALYLQDGTAAAVGASSIDGGRTWERAPVLTATTCTGGPPERDAAFNPLLSQGADGRVYYGYTNYDTVVFATDDAAGVWDPAVSPGDHDDSQNLTVLADAVMPARVIAIWTHFDFVSTPVGSAPRNTELRLALSGDGARSFDAPRIVAPSPPGRLIINSRLVRASDGAALACYDSAAVQDVPNQVLGKRTEFMVACMRSEDGVEWSAPVPAGPSVYLPLADPEGRETPGADPTFLGGSAKFDLATGPTGLALLVHADETTGGGGRLRLMRSDDDGASWSGPVDVMTRSAPMFEPALAIGADGSIGLFWYDWARDVPGDEGVSTDAWMARSIDGGQNWQLTHLAGPFDLRAAHQAGLLYDGGALGTYQDLVALPGGFGAAFTVGPPLATDGRTDVWFARVR